MGAVGRLLRGAVGLRVGSAARAPLIVPGEAAFSPRSIPGLVLWLDPDPEHVALFDDHVTAWLDQSGDETNLLQPTESKRPLYSPNGGSNDRGYLDFDGLNDELFTSSAITTSIAWTYFVVLKPDVTTGDKHIFVNGSLGGGVGFSSSTAGKRAVVARGVAYQEDGPIQTADWEIWSASASPDWATLPSGIASFWLNGAAVALTGSALPLAPSARTSVGAVGGIVPYNGKLGSVLAWNRILSTDERRDVELYLSDYYAIPVV